MKTNRIVLALLIASLSLHANIKQLERDLKGSEKQRITALAYKKSWKELQDRVTQLLQALKKEDKNIEYENNRANLLDELDVYKKALKLKGAQEYQQRFADI